MPFPLNKITLTTLILWTVCLSSFQSKGQNIRHTEEKDIWRSFSLPFIDTSKHLRYTTLERAKQENKGSYRESRSAADCKTATFYMHVSPASGEKIRLYDVQTLLGGNFLAFGSLTSLVGDEEGLVVRMSSTGDVISKNKVRIQGNSVIINSVKVWPSGKIVIAGLINSSNSIFIAELKDDLMTSWSSIFSLTSKPSKVKLELYDLDNAAIGIVAQLPSSVVYSNLTTMGQLLWTKEAVVDGLTDLVGFSTLGYGTFGLIVNCVRNSKAVIAALQVALATGNIVSSHILGDGSKQMVGLTTTAFGGRLKILAMSQLSLGEFRIERNIMYSSDVIETKHIYSINEKVDSNVTGAIDNAGDAMGICLPQAGKMIFIKQFADYYATSDNTREYNVPAQANIVSVSRSFDGGFLFGLNTKNAEEIIFIKTDSSGIIAGCNYADVHNDVVEQFNTQNTVSNASANSVYLNSVPATIALMEASFSTRFDCRQNYCPPSPADDICLSTYYKTLRSNSYVDAFTSYYLMRNNNHLALTQRYDRILGGQNQITVGLKLFDEKGIFIKGVNVFLDGVSSSAVCRKMDDKSIMFISYSTIRHKYF